jgi:hypothetical protein
VCARAVVVVVVVAGAPLQWGLPTKEVANQCFDMTPTDHSECEEQVCISAFDNDDTASAECRESFSDSQHN